MHKKPPVNEPCGQCFLRLISDQMFVVFVPVFVTQRLRIALLLEFVVDQAQSKILSQRKHAHDLLSLIFVTLRAQFKTEQQLLRN